MAKPQSAARVVVPARRQFSARQAQVIDALEAIFFAEGLEPTVGELAARVHCSRATLYDIAPSKEDLFLVVIDRMMRRIGRNARIAVAAETTFAGRIEADLAAGIAAFQPASSAFTDALESNEPAAGLFNYHLSTGRDVLIELIGQGIEAGEFAAVPAELAAEVLMAATQRMTDPRFLRENRIQVADAMEQMFRLILRGLLIPETSQPKEQR